MPPEISVSKLEHLREEMSSAETGHVLVFGLVCLFAVYALLRGWLAGAGWLMLFNLLINGYPVLLQRYNRIKLGELIQTIQLSPGQIAVQP
jgi:hypothetical protein